MNLSLSAVNHRLRRYWSRSPRAEGGGHQDGLKKSSETNGTRSPFDPGAPRDRPDALLVLTALLLDFRAAAVALFAITGVSYRHPQQQQARLVAFDWANSQMVDALPPPHARGSQPPTAVALLAGMAGW